jgi:voltage-gated sodium channel
MIGLCRKLVAAPAFERVVIAVILLSAVLVGLETVPGLMQRWGPWLTLANHVVLAVFIAEAAVKLTAHAPRPLDYFRSGWNLFDFAVIVASLLPAAGEFAMVARLVRLLRVLRLVSAMPKLRLIVSTLVRVIPGLGNVLLLMGILFYIYGVAGYHLYAEHDPDHFGTLPRAVLTLFQVVTLEGWSDIMRTAMALNPWHWLYFVSFVLLGTFVVINLFIAIVVNSLEETHREVEEQEAAASDAGADLRAARELLAQVQARLARLEAGERARGKAG